MGGWRGLSLVRSYKKNLEERKKHRSCENRGKRHKLSSGLCCWKTENLLNSLSSLSFMDLPVEGFLVSSPSLVKTPTDDCGHFDSSSWSLPVVNLIIMNNNKTQVNPVLV